MVTRQKIELDFILWEQAIQDDISEELHKDALLETYLELPVTFSVDEINLLETVSRPTNIIQVDPTGKAEVVIPKPGQSPSIEPWVVLPLLDFAIRCYEKVREACKGIKSIYETPGGSGKLVFEMDDDKISIHSTINNKTVVSGCPELIAAFAAFSTRARDLAERLFPELKMDMTWRSCFA